MDVAGSYLSTALHQTFLVKTAAEWKPQIPINKLDSNHNS
jgi:hypothetical protein